MFPPSQYHLQKVIILLTSNTEDQFCLFLNLYNLKHVVWGLCIWLLSLSIWDSSMCLNVILVHGDDLDFYFHKSKSYLTFITFPYQPSSQHVSSSGFRGEKDFRTLNISSPVTLRDEPKVTPLVLPRARTRKAWCLDSRPVASPLPFAPVSLNFSSLICWPCFFFWRSNRKAHLPYWQSPEQCGLSSFSLLFCPKLLLLPFILINPQFFEIS